MRITAVARFLRAGVFLSVACGAAYAGQFVAPGRYSPSDEDATACFFDVGQADAVLLRTPDNRNILIDGGSPPYTLQGGETVDAKEIYPFLENEGVRQIDTIIISHSHADHAAGLVKVLEQLPVRQVVITGYDGGDPEYAACREIIEKKKIPCRALKEGAMLYWDHGITGEILGPPTGFSFDSTNNNSLIVRIRYGTVSMLFPGDAESEEEDWAVTKSPKLLAADILKVPHHGSYNSLNGTFLSAVAPTVAIFSCGRGNPFGHPHQRTEAFYRKKKIRYYRTDRDGTVRVTMNGTVYSLQCEGKSR